MNQNRNLQKKFEVSGKAQSLFEKVVLTPTEKRRELLKILSDLREAAGLDYALRALYRQQVYSGFVLADPLKTEGKEKKIFSDPDTGITFCLQWNPDRELRKDHHLLIERGVIAGDIDETRLINKDRRGKACYLCKMNIDRQNPGEILLEIALAGEIFYIGANFAYITDNHFTLMNADHRPQRYRKEILEVSNEFIDKTNGVFRIVFNGLAGASIKEHEHLQATTEVFPLEGIRIRKEEDVMYESNDINVFRPEYYLPVWIVEGKDKTKNEYTADRIIRKWQSLNEHHTENIIATRAGDCYRTFIILRDRRKLAGTGKKGALASFETGGRIILSYRPEMDREGEIDERKIFEAANLETIKQLLREVAPDEQSCSRLAETVDFE